MASLINKLAGDLLAKPTVPVLAKVGERKNRDWMKYAFMIPFTTDASGRVTAALDEIDLRNTTFSNAFFKFTDQTVGGNFAINPPPAYTVYADPPVRGLHPNAVRAGVTIPTGPIGMGDYWSTAVDDTGQYIHFRFGVASHNSLTQFFNGFHNGSLSRLVRTGRTDQNLFEKFFEYALKVVQVAVLPLTIIPVMFMFTAGAIRFLLRMPASKFYYLKPSMPLYWHTVNSIVNQMAVNMQIATYTTSRISEGFIGEILKTDNSKRTLLHDLYPELKEDGTIDVYSIITKAKRLQNNQRKYLLKQLTAPGADGWYGKVQKVMSESGSVQLANAQDSIPFSSKTFMEKFFDTPYAGKPDGQDNEKATEKDWRDPVKAAKNDKGVMEAAGNYASEVANSALEYFKAVADDGAEWLTLRVDYTGPQSESFSSSSAPSSLAEKMNSASASAREMKFNMADGNIDSAGVAQMLTDGVSTLISGGLDLLYMGGLVQFAGSAFVDIPEHWTESTASIKPSAYTFRLCAPHGNRISQLLHLYLPMAAIMAGALPLAHGKQSYGAPFLCEIYDRGRCSARLAMIDSVSFTRGVSNLGFNKEAQALAIDVNITVKDLSTVLAVPVQQGLSLNPLEGIFDVDNKYTEYTAALAALPLTDFDYRLPILKRQIDTKIANIKSYFSVPRLMMDLGTSSPAALYGMFMAGTPRK